MTKHVPRCCVECGREIVASTRGRPRRYCGRACQARAYRARSDLGTAGAAGMARGTTAGRRAIADRSPNHRGNLDLRTIVRVAITMADAEGIERVSMRAVAARLDVPVMSIYRHVRNKQELIHRMVEAAFSDQPDPPVERTVPAAKRTGPLVERTGAPGQRPDTPPDTPPGWRAVLAREARREWALYRHHPWMLHVLASSRPPLGPSVLDSIDRTVRALVDAGVEDDPATMLYLLLSGYVQGAALLLVSEQDAVRDTGISRAVWWSRQRRSKAAGLADTVRYPWLARPLSEGGPNVLTDLEDWFEFGLQRVLDGIEEYVDGAG